MAWSIKHQEKMGLFESAYRGERAAGRVDQMDAETKRMYERVGSSDANVDAVKAAFRKWDLDGNGIIDKYELMMVMRHLCHVSESDLEALMQEADTNKDGEVDYEEFVDWLMRPPAKSQGKAIFDYAQALEPIFDAYDTYGTGVITFDEFEECHHILKGALRAHLEDSDSSDDEADQKQRRRNSTAKKTHLYDPLMLNADAEEAFKLCDSNKDSEITFREFVNWMRDFIDQSEIDKEALTLLTARVGQMLKSCLKQKRIVQDAGQQSRDDVEAYKVFVSNLARTTDQLESALKPKDYVEQVGTTWSEPPMGLNVDRLKATHLRFFPLNMKKVNKVHMSVFCVPLPGDDKEREERIWLGEVVRKVDWRNAKAGQSKTDKPAYYVYERERFRWLPLWKEQELHAAGFHHGGAGVFQAALDNLAPELGLFCLLKTEANFGIQLKWPSIMTALHGAIDIGFLEEEQVDQYVKYVRDSAWQAIKAEGVIKEEDGEVSKRIAIDEFLAEKVVMRPRVVMATLSKLGIMKIHDVWKEFVSAD